MTSRTLVLTKTSLGCLSILQRRITNGRESKKSAEVEQSESRGEHDCGPIEDPQLSPARLGHSGNANNSLETEAEEQKLQISEMVTPTKVKYYAANPSPANRETPSRTKKIRRRSSSRSRARQPRFEFPFRHLQVRTAS